MTRKRRRPSSEQRTPLPVQPVNLLAGIAPGIDLGADDLPAGVAGTEAARPATVSVEAVGKMLRCGDATVRRLIQSGVLRPVEERGEVRIRRTEVLALRAGVLPATSDKPGE
jgi:excisionase family DNA binding protein